MLEFVNIQRKLSNKISLEVQIVLLIDTFNKVIINLSLTI